MTNRSTEGNFANTLLGAVMSSAYWVELNGGNILIVVADSVGDACDKLDSMNFENYSIKHDKTMVALV